MDVDPTTLTLSVNFRPTSDLSEPTPRHPWDLSVERMVATVTAVVGWCLCLAVCQVKSSYVPTDMNRTIQNLLDHYKITSEVRFDGKPVFANNQLSGNLEAEMIYMGAVLKTYDTLLNQMLKQLPAAKPSPAQTPGQRGAAAEDPRAQLSYLLKKVSDLRREHYVKQEQLLQKLQPLAKVEFNNSVIQSKALWELIKIYEEASSLPNKMERRRRRRRRQTQTIKAHQRA